MIFYSDGKILIRNLEDKDVQVITEEEIAQGWDASAEKYITRLQDQREGRAIALAAEYCGDVAGYVNVYPNSVWGAFAGMGLPEIVDFGVLEKYRGRGIGSKLMDVAEVSGMDPMYVPSMPIAVTTMIWFCICRKEFLRMLLNECPLKRAGV